MPMKWPALNIKVMTKISKERKSHKRQEDFSFLSYDTLPHHLESVNLMPKLIQSLDMMSVLITQS